MSTPGRTARSQSAKGAEALASWCGSGGRSSDLPGIKFAEGGGDEPVDIVIDSAPLACGAGGDWTASSLSLL
jgi:hypothetical protein